MSLAEAYSSSAATWAAGPDLVYRQLGTALVEVLADALDGSAAGARVLDLGAGTGAVSVALEAAGAHVVAVDIALGMLAFERSRRPPGVVADALALPLRAGSLAAAAAGCCLGHLREPGRALATLGEVVRPGGVIAASAFSTAWNDPLKAAVDAALIGHGWVAPEWYRAFKGETERATGSASALAALAEGCGLGHRVVEVAVAVRLDGPAAVVDWRLGMAHIAPFVAGLDAARRDALRADAAAAVTAAAGAGPVCVEVPLLVLVARA